MTDILAYLHQVQRKCVQDQTQDNHKKIALGMLLYVESQIESKMIEGGLLSDSVGGADCWLVNSFIE
jgi:hypothetical protein